MLLGDRVIDFIVFGSFGRNELSIEEVVVDSGGSKGKSLKFAQKLHLLRLTINFKICFTIKMYTSMHQFTGT